MVDGALLDVTAIYVELEKNVVLLACSLPNYTRNEGALGAAARNGRRDPLLMEVGAGKEIIRNRTEKVLHGCATFPALNMVELRCGIAWGGGGGSTGC